MSTSYQMKVCWMIFEMTWNSEENHYEKKSGGEIKFTKEFREFIYARDGGECWYCGVKISRYEDIRIDHQIPKSRNGSHCESNLVLCCHKCNSSKGKKTVEEHRKAIQIRTANLPVTFSKIQIEWLSCHGFELPLPEPPVFNGEKCE